MTCLCSVSKMRGEAWGRRLSLLLVQRRHDDHRRSRKPLQGQCSRRLYRPWALLMQLELWMQLSLRLHRAPVSLVESKHLPLLHRLLLLLQLCDKHKTL